jgi:hypothetical protein
LKEWKTLNSRNTPSATNLEEDEIVDAPGNDGNTSMPEEVKRSNPWRKKKKMINKHTTCFITLVITVLQCVMKPFYKGRIRLSFFL